MAVQPIPAGYPTITTYLIVADANAAIEFYKQAFTAEELFRLPMPDGRVAHAELKIGDSIFMLADEFPEMDAKSPHAYGGSPVSMLVYVADVNSAFSRAIAAGGKELRPLADQFYGDRSGTLVDPFGHKWTLATHIEDVSPEEMNRRMASMPKP